jgi:hypothetical protein
VLLFNDRREDKPMNDLIETQPASPSDMLRDALNHLNNITNAWARAVNDVRVRMAEADVDGTISRASFVVKADGMIHTGDLEVVFVVDEGVYVADGVRSGTPSNAVREFVQRRTFEKANDVRRLSYVRGTEY